MKWFLSLIDSVGQFILDSLYAKPVPVPTTPIQEETPMAITPSQSIPVPPYLWDTPENARHSLRVICDEEGLTVEQKNTMSQVVHCESEYKIAARLDNKDKNGNIWSTDAGLCQWNSYWHGKEISTDEAFNDPEKAVRLMCQYVKNGQLKQWVCFSSGKYLGYTA